MAEQQRLLRIWQLATVVGVGLIAGGSGVAEAGHSTYLALGDSITFGVGKNETASDISDGVRGYVSGYANYLTGLAGGDKLNVVNLAVSGETSSSFFGKSFGLDGSAAALRNTNYSGTTPPSQDAMMLTAIQSQMSLGNTITTVTMSLGANDLFVALAARTSFSDALATFQANELTLLTQIRTMLPTANLILLNYYDPFAPFVNDPTSPFYQTALASSQAIPMLNAIIAADALMFGAGYADVFTPFQGNELADTYISTGNVHPMDVGYGLITTAVESVPEPSSMILVTIGVSLLAVAGRRTRSPRGSEAQTTVS